MFTKLVTSLAGLGVAASLVLVPVAGSASAAVPPVPPQAATPVATHAALANAALNRAISKVRAHQYGQARTALATARTHVRQTNTLAVRQIGRQPADPESDVLPGPPVVRAALQLDNRVTVRLVPLFNRMADRRMVDAVRATIQVAQTSRAVVLNRVLRLPAEEDSDDYADVLADTLPLYHREVTTIDHARDTFTLIPPSHYALTGALSRARTAEARMIAAFGGGERAMV